MLCAGMRSSTSGACPGDGPPGSIPGVRGWVRGWVGGYGLPPVGCQSVLVKTFCSRHQQCAHCTGVPVPRLLLQLAAAVGGTPSPETSTAAAAAAAAGAAAAPAAAAAARQRLAAPAPPPVEPPRHHMVRQCHHPPRLRLHGGSPSPCFPSRDCSSCCCCCCCWTSTTSVSARSGRFNSHPRSGRGCIRARTLRVVARTFNPSWL